MEACPGTVSSLERRRVGKRRSEDTRGRAPTSWPKRRAESALEILRLETRFGAFEGSNKKAQKKTEKIKRALLATPRSSPLISVRASGRYRAGLHADRRGRRDECGRWRRRSVAVIDPLRQAFRGERPARFLHFHFSLGKSADSDERQLHAHAGLESAHQLVRELARFVSRHRINVHAHALSRLFIRCR